jgi:hypothetical protein
MVYTHSIHPWYTPIAQKSINTTTLPILGVLFSFSFLGSLNPQLLQWSIVFINGVPYECDIVNAEGEAPAEMEQEPPADVEVELPSDVEPPAGQGTPPPQGVRYSVWCPICAKQFPSIMGKHWHMKQHQPGGATRYQCLLCNQTFTREASRKRNERKPHSSLIFPFS